MCFRLFPLLNYVLSQTLILYLLAQAFFIPGFLGLITHWHASISMDTMHTFLVHSPRIME